MNTPSPASPQQHAFVSHPWHGIDPALDAEGHVTVFIEIVPGQDMKFELDKPSGWLKIDRPQKFSSRPPAMYGLIPRTLCATRVGNRCMEVTGRTGIKGDGDPMDVVLLAEHAPAYGGLLAHGRIIGGIRMIDGGEADDKIVCVLDGDAVYGKAHDIGDIPQTVIDHWRHYLTTYKQPPGVDTKKVEIAEIYGRGEGIRMARLSLDDYAEQYGH